MENLSSFKFNTSPARPQRFHIKSLYIRANPPGTVHLYIFQKIRGWCENMISFWKIYVYCYNYKWAKPCVFVLFVNRQFLKLSALTPPKWQQMNWALNQSSAVESKGKSNKVHLSLLPLIGGNGASNERYLSTLAHEVIPNIHILKRRIYCSQFRKQPSQRVLKQRKKCKSCQATVSLSCLTCLSCL